MAVEVCERIDRIIGNLKRPPALAHPDPSTHTLHDRMACLSIPGVSVAVIDHFDVAWHKGFGVRKNGLPACVTEDTPFQAASISKSVFALAVMRLHQDKRIDLDEDITRIIRSWNLPTDDNGLIPKVTLRQLLSHSAGATVHGFPGYSMNAQWPTVTEVLDGAPPANTPPVLFDLVSGTQFRYSGGGTTIAQLAVTDATDQPFADFMHELMFKPLGMRDSSYEQPLSENMKARAAAGHLHDGVPIPGDWHVYPEMAAAGLWTTAGDLARLGVAVMRGLRGEATNLGLFRENLTAMLQPQIPGESVGMDFAGLGWFCTGKDDQFRFGHSGVNHGFLAELQLRPVKGQGVVVMVNSDQGGPLIRELVESIEREYGWLI
ncbi:serine hydrolase domain-containing protein [Azospirillum griseum]|nr:serine hydrolase domain-containing protein [Azospirillum griseum]